MSALDWLDGELVTSAYGWRLVRRDGVVLGLTSHDRDVEIGGVTYRAAPGMLPTSLLQVGGMEAGGLDIEGALTSDAIRQDDLAAGRWDGARLVIFLFDWIDPMAAVRLLATGELGNLSRSGGTFRAELRALAAALDRECVPVTSPTCRAAFGDGQCGLSRARFRKEARVMALSDTNLTLDLDPAPAAQLYAYGELRWLSGANCGLRQAVLASSGATVTLADPPFLTAGPGDRVELTQGCDRTIAICADRFGNAINFRGEPYLPGNDLLTRYPGAA